MRTHGFIIIWAIGASLLHAGEQEPTHAPPIWHSSTPKAFAFHDLESNYWDLYPRGDAVLIEAITPLKEGVGFFLQLVSDDPDIVSYVYTINDAKEVTAADGFIRVQFEDNHTLENYATERRELAIQGVRSDDSRSRVYHLATNFYPSERYLANGRIEDGHGRIHIRESDLNFVRTRREDWILQEPTTEDIAFARETWGPLLDPEKTAYEQARALASSLVAELTPHRGTPSDVMDQLPPFDQYRRLLAGEDHCWCANIATIFAHACNAFGIPTRFIIMRHQLFPPPPTGEEGTEILMAGGHTTNEIFSSDHQQWIWIDLTYNLWGAYLGDEGPLNMLELHHALNDPGRFARLEADHFDPATKKTTRIRIAEHPIRINLLNAFKQDQLFRYMRRPADR